MGQKFLIDSNIIIDYLSGKVPPDKSEFMHSVINDIPAVSVMSKIEVLGFNAPVEELKLLEGFFDDAVLLELNSDITEQTISIRRAVKIKTPDAVIAATALVYVYNLTLITRNISDFKNIKGLTVIDPYAL